MIKNVVFDIGNVLLKFDPKKYLTKKFNDQELISKLNEVVY